MSLVNANHANRPQAILKVAADLFAGNDSPAKSEILHFEELSLRLLPKIDLESRAHIAERLATSQNLPKATALALATDDFVVAKPIINAYTGFEDSDLLLILVRGDQRHAAALAARQDLSERIVFALARSHHMRGETTEVSASQIEDEAEPRDAATVSEHQEEEALEINWTDEPKNETSKPDTPSPMFSETDAKQRSLMLPRLDEFLSGDHTLILDYARQCEALAAESDEEPNALLKAAFRRAETALEFRRLAHDRDADGFAALLARQTGLNVFATRKIIRDADGFALATCLKALALPGDLAVDAFLLLNPALGQNSRQIFLIEWFYGQLTPRAARLIADRWSRPFATPVKAAGNTYSEALRPGLAQNLPREKAETVPVERSALKRA
ncbi:MAG: hypothetical protein AAGE61_15355 [Pseudomonadota bacterium]